MPISRDFGFDRGTPIDRYYIDRFLERHAAEIVGRVLEIGGDDYTPPVRRQAGHARRCSPCRPGNPRATIVGDLTDPVGAAFERLRLHCPDADAASDL